MKFFLLLAAVVVTSIAQFQDFDYDQPIQPGTFDYLAKDTLEVRNGISLNKRQMIFPKFTNDIDASELADILSLIPENPEDLDEATLQDIEEKAKNVLGNDVEKRQMIFPKFSNDVDMSALTDILSLIPENPEDMDEATLQDIEEKFKDTFGKDIEKRQMLFKPPGTSTDAYIKSMEDLKDNFANFPSKPEDRESTSPNKDQYDETLDSLMKWLGGTGALGKPIWKRFLFSTPEQENDGVFGTDDAMNTMFMMDLLGSKKRQAVEYPGENGEVDQSDLKDLYEKYGGKVSKRQAVYYPIVPDENGNIDPSAFEDVLQRFGGLTSKRQAVYYPVVPDENGEVDLFAKLGGPVSKRQLVYNPIFRDENGQMDDSALGDLSDLLGGPVSKRQLVYNPIFRDANGQIDNSALGDLSDLLGGPVSKRQIPSISSSNFGKFIKSKYGMNESDWNDMLEDMKTVKDTDDLLTIFSDALSKAKDVNPDAEE